MLSALYYHLFLILAAVVSYEDWRYRKIRNRWIAAGLAACAAGFLWLLLGSLFAAWKLRFLGLGEFYLPFSFYPLSAAHLILVAVAGLATWHLGVWPAGDAKLYMTCGVFVVLIEHNLRGFPLILFLKLLINIFVPAGIWILAGLSLRLLWNIPRLRPRELRREAVAIFDRAFIRVNEFWPYRLAIGVYALNVLALFLALELLSHRVYAMSFMQTPIGKLLLLLVLFTFWGRIGRFLQNRGIATVWGVLLVFLYFDPRVAERGLAPVVGDVVRMVLLFSVGLVAFRALVTALLRSEARSEVSLADLRPGMILSEDSWRVIHRASRESGRPAPTRFPDGLFEEDLEGIRTLASIPNAALGAYRATPFAVWVVIGTVLTMVLDKNIMFYLMRAFGGEGWAVILGGLRRWWGI